MADFIHTIIENTVAFGTAFLMAFGIGDYTQIHSTAPSPDRYEPTPSAHASAAGLRGIKELHIETWLSNFFSSEENDVPIRKKKNVTRLPRKAVSENIQKADTERTKARKARSERAPTSIEEDTQKETPPQAQAQKEEDERVEDTPRVVYTPIIPPQELNERIRPSIVNILCLSKYGGFFEPLSGSGVMIDPSGVVLTNAHVAQYFLIEDYKEEDFVKCVIRTGSPAKVSYEAELLFLPPLWLQANAGTITKARSTGTGEHDYALLRITKGVRNTPLPDPFPYVPLSSSQEAVFRGAPVLVASYPAGFSGGIATQKDLWLTTTIAKIKELYTFDDKPGRDVDIFEISGTVSAQEGTSGGAAVDFQKGEVVGIAATRTQGKTTSERALRILSAYHIRESFEKQTKISLDMFLTGDVEAYAFQFASTTLPSLQALIIQSID